MLVTLGAFKENIMRKKHITIANAKFELLPFCTHLYYSYRNKYYNSKWSHLNDCYKNPSFFKMIICENIEVFGRHNNCKDFRILSYNYQFFTAGIRTTIKNKPYILIFTPKHNYILEDFHDEK